MKLWITAGSAYGMTCLLLCYMAAAFFGLWSRRCAAGCIRVMAVCRFLLHGLGFLTIFLVTKNYFLLPLYLLQVAFLGAADLIQKHLYEKVPLFLYQNMQMLLAVGLLFLARLSVEKSWKQMLIAFAAFGVSLFLPKLLRLFSEPERFYGIYAAAGIALLMLVLLSGISIFGAKNWLSFRNVTFQPSEFVKLFYILFLAGALTGRRKHSCEATGDSAGKRKGSPAFSWVLAVSAVAAVHVGLLALSNDFGGALLFFAVYIIVIFVVGRNLLLPLAAMALGSLAAYGAYLYSGHIKDRVLAWQDPFSCIEKEGYQVAQSLFAVGGGGWFGSGLAQGMPKTIPVVTSDFIFAAVCEELGAVFAALLLVLYLNCLFCFVSLALEQKKPFFFAVTVGAAALFGFQMFLNVGGVLKLIPSTGVTLPFISYGGSSLCSMLWLVEGIYAMAAAVQEKQERNTARAGKKEREAAGRGLSQKRTARRNPSQKRASGRRISKGQAAGQSLSQERTSGRGGKKGQAVQGLMREKASGHEVKKTQTAGRNPSQKRASGRRISKGQAAGRQVQREMALPQGRFIGVSSFGVIAVCFLVISFLAVTVPMAKQEFFNSYNPRVKAMEQQVLRGKILASGGEILAQSIAGEDGEMYRVYPFGEAAAFVTGRLDNGKTGLEEQENAVLLTVSVNALERFLLKTKEGIPEADNLITTIDARLQLAAYQALSGYRGAIGVMDAESGKILAFVSTPAYNPNNIVTEWEQLAVREDSPLLNRMTYGLYPPGSTFKTVTTLAWLKEHSEADFLHTCTGSERVNGIRVHCYNERAHGTQTLKKAFANSCNTAYASMGTQISVSAFQDTAQALGFGTVFSGTLPYAADSFPLTESTAAAVTVQTAFGQGETLITPFHNLMLAAAIAGGGTLRLPYLVERIQNYKGETVEEFHTAGELALMSREETELLTDYMIEASASMMSEFAQAGILVAGKTGSAEVTKELPAHSWYICFAEKEEDFRENVLGRNALGNNALGEDALGNNAPGNNALRSNVFGSDALERNALESSDLDSNDLQNRNIQKYSKIAICVLAEYAGTGSAHAVPIAKKILREYFGMEE